MLKPRFLKLPKINVTLGPLLFLFSCTSQTVSQNVEIAISKDLINNLAEKNNSINSSSTNTSSSLSSPQVSPAPPVLMATNNKAQTPSPLPSPIQFESKAPQAGERIIFLLSNGRFYAMKPDGSGLDAITPVAFKFSTQSKISPTGQFVYSYDITSESLNLYHLNGELFKQWKIPGAEPFRWSPNGRWILLYDKASRFPILVDINADTFLQAGKQVRRDDANSTNLLLHWSPDSSKIGFISTDGFAYTYAPASGQLSATLNQTSLRSLKLKETGWSGDSKYLSVIQTNDTRNYQVLVLPVDGRGAFVLSDTDGFHVWSSNPEQAFLSVSNNSVYIFDVGSGSDIPRQTIAVPQLVDSMGWLFSQKFSYQLGNQLFVVEDNNNVVKLPLDTFIAKPTGLANFYISPDRSFFAFSSKGKVFKIGADHQVQEIASLAGEISNLVWVK